MIQARIIKRFPPGPESAGFTLEIELQAGAGVTALFGPSGAGKTLTLDTIAGFTRPDLGRILVDDQILFDAASHVNLRPQERHCGYVFQNYALFPHMTLRQNLVFAADRHPRLERHRRVNEMLERFHLTDVSGRRPVYGGTRKFQEDAHWRDLILFYEYFHGDNGAGLGASHQTGWTGIIARVMHLFATTTAEQLLDLGAKAAIVETESAWGLELAPR